MESSAELLYGISALPSRRKLLSSSTRIFLVGVLEIGKIALHIRQIDGMIDWMCFEGSR